MGLLDKIKDNAKTISIKAIESTNEYNEDHSAKQSINAEPSDAGSVAIEEPEVITPSADEPSDSPADDTTSEPEPSDEEDSEGTDADTKEEPEKAESEEKPARKSKITEIPKDKYEESKSPHYKSEAKKSDDKNEKDTDKDDKVEVKKSKSKKEQKKIHQSKSQIIDIAPKKTVDNVKEAIYARERATMAALSTQRRMNGTVPLYSTSHMNFRTRVFVNRIEYIGSFGKTVLPVERVSWIKLRHGGTGVIIETNENKRLVLVIKPTDRLAFADAVIRVQGMKPKKGKPVDRSIRLDQLEKFGDGIDEIEKLARLLDKGIITESEFEAKKKQILGI